jgi:hypothetical protein
VERAEQMSADREGTVESYRERLRAEREAVASA